MITLIGHDDKVNENLTELIELADDGVDVAVLRRDVPASDGHCGCFESNRRREEIKSKPRPITNYTNTHSHTAATHKHSAFVSLIN